MFLTLEESAVGNLRRSSWRAFGELKLPELLELLDGAFVIPTTFVAWMMFSIAFVAILIISSFLGIAPARGVSRHIECTSWYKGAQWIMEFLTPAMVFGI